jgi:probable phosphoglycerate mutase
MAEEKTLILLVRHGQTEWNRIERFRGQADVPLNEVGLRQAEATGLAILRKYQLAAVYTSPLSRSVATAQAIARHYDLPVQLHPDMIDIDYGDWQGLTTEEARQRWPKQVENWYTHPQRAFIPGGETLASLRRRAMRTVAELAQQHAGQTIALVGHTVINRVILLGVLGLGNRRFWHLRQDTCAINVIEVWNGDYALVSLNDTCHLD